MSQLNRLNAKDIMINIGWALLLRVIVIGMSFLMAITGTQTETETIRLSVTSPSAWTSVSWPRMRL